MKGGEKEEGITSGIGKEGRRRGEGGGIGGIEEGGTQDKRRDEEWNLEGGNIG